MFEMEFLLFYPLRVHAILQHEQGVISLILLKTVWLYIYACARYALRIPQHRAQVSNRVLWLGSDCTSGGDYFYYPQVYDISSPYGSRD